MLSSLALRRDGWLIWSLAQRSLESRYRGSAFGLFWTLLQPLATLAIYSVVFGGVMRVQFAGGTASDFIVFVFCGLLAFSLLAESLNGSVTVLRTNANLIRQSSVRPHVFPLSVTIAALIGQIPAWLLLVVVALLLHRLSWTAVTLPLLLLPLLLISAGINVFAAALAVFFHDITQIVGIALTALFLLTPIFYPASAVPESLRWILHVNPLAWLVIAFRQVLLLGELPSMDLVVSSYVAGVVLFAIGIWTFSRLQPAFPDVL